MRSQRAEQEAALEAIKPTIECEIKSFSMDEWKKTTVANGVVARKVREGWSIQGMAIDAHSSALVYTFLRAVRPEPAPPQPMRVG